MSPARAIMFDYYKTVIQVADHPTSTSVTETDHPPRTNPSTMSTHWGTDQDTVKTKLLT